MNPLLANTNSMNMAQQPAPMMNPMQMMQQGVSPQQIANMIMQRNPQAAQRVQQLQSMCGSRNPRDFVLNMCRQNGMGDQAMQMANMMGLR